MGRMSHHAPHVLKFTAGKRTVAAQLPSLILSWGKLPTSRAQCPSPLPETLHTPRITARRRPSRSALSAGALRGSPEPSGDRQLSESLRSLRRRTGEQRLPTRRPVSVASKEALWTLFLTPVACCCRCPSPATAAADRIVPEDSAGPPSENSSPGEHLYRWTSQSGLAVSGGRSLVPKRSRAERSLRMPGPQLAPNTAGPPKPPG